MTTKSGVQPKARTIHSCNFRYAGRLSNENARALTSLHEKFALNVTNSLEVYLGTSIRLKMVSLEQLGSPGLHQRRSAEHLPAAPAP